MKPYHKNPRQITKKQFDDLKENLSYLGDLSGIVHELNSDEIIGGNQRSAVFDVNKCDVEIVHEYDSPDKQGTVAQGFIIWEGKRYTYRQVRWTPKQAEQANITANRLGGEWDFDELANWDMSDLLEWGFEEKDFPFDVAGAMGEGGDTEPQISKADELLEKWQVKTGDLWQLGDHMIICGDCTDRAVVERVMQGEKASIVFTDPPYGVAIGAKNRMLNSFQPSGRNLTDIEDDEMSPEELKQRLLPAFNLIREVAMADDCTVFLTAPQGGDLGMMMMMMRDAKLPIRHVLIWKKNAPTFSMGRLDYDYQHEPILLTWGKRHKRPMLGTHKTSVWEIDKPRASAEHPTMKPVELYENAYLNNSEMGDVAYEPYSGSGTAIIACQNLSRKCRAVEVSAAYVSVALERFHQHSGILPTLIP